MCRLPIFFSQLLTVVAGVVLLVMTAAFVMLPYSLGANPGQTRVPAVNPSFHAT